MTAIATNEAPIIAAAAVEDGQHIFASTEHQFGRGSIDVGKKASMVDVQRERQDDDVTEEDLVNLRRVSGKIPWAAYTIAFVELCERFSYYGTTVVCKSIPIHVQRTSDTFQMSISFSSLCQMAHLLVQAIVASQELWVWVSVPQPA